MEKTFNSNPYVILAIVLAVFAVGFSAYGMKSDSMLMYLSSMEERIAANAQLSPPASDTTLQAFYVVCEESDTRGSADIARPGGTAIMAFYINPTTLDRTNLTFDSSGVINYKGVGKVGEYHIWKDWAETGWDFVPIGPEPTPSTPIQKGIIQEYYCNPAKTGTMAAPLIVSDVSAYSIISHTGFPDEMDYVAFARVNIKMMSTKAWSLTMYGKTFSGLAHTSP